MTTVLILAGCAPTVITLPAPELPAAAAHGPAIELAWPVDARPTNERSEGSYYVGNVPSPQNVYGDLNLRPGAVVAIDRAVRAGLSEQGIPQDPDAPLHARVYLLHHAGWRDISDAQWVSTATGNLVGNVPKLLYPAYALVTVRLRLEVTDPGGETVLLRDFEALEVRDKPLFFSWPWPYAFTRAPMPEAFTEAFAAAHTSLGHDIGLALHQLRSGHEVTAGVQPVEPAEHTADAIWWRGARGSMATSKLSWEDPIATELYGTPRFSVVTGHDLAPGEVVGRIGFPVDNFAWDAGLHRRWAIQGSATALFQPFDGLRFYTNLGGGFRYKPITGKRAHLALQPYFALDLPIVTGDGLRPKLAAARAGALAQVSWRHEWLTLFGSAGPAWTQVLHTYPDIPALADLDQGVAVSLNATLGVELQVAPSVAFAFELRGISVTQGGEDVTIGPLSGPTLAPQVSVGLR